MKFMMFFPFLHLYFLFVLFNKCCFVTKNDVKKSLFVYNFWMCGVSMYFDVSRIMLGSHASQTIPFKRVHHIWNICKLSLFGVSRNNSFNMIDHFAIVKSQFQIEKLNVEISNWQRKKTPIYNYHKCVKFLFTHTYSWSTTIQCFKLLSYTQM